MQAFQLLIFAGVSGSGKSTSIQSVVGEHPAFKYQDRTVITGSPIQWNKELPPTRLVLLDELVCLTDLYQVVRLLMAGHQVIAASHLPSMAHFLLAVLFKARITYVDEDPVTIARYLANQGIACSDRAVAEFHALYRASFIDLKLVLEQNYSNDFDKAWARFNKAMQIIKTPAPVETEYCVKRVSYR